MPVHGIVQGLTVPIKLWIPPHEVESEALNQLRDVASLKWVYGHVAAMPDVHAGKGATVGSVIPMLNAVAPAAVGVDIGCGMGAIRVKGLRAEDLTEDRIRQVFEQLHLRIPLGPTSHEKVHRDIRSDALFEEFDTLIPTVHDHKQRALAQVGTLGSGNHFIELCVDKDDHVWMMLHSGSRYIGKEVAEHHIRLAKTLPHNHMIPTRDLSVFLDGEPGMLQYKNDLYWCQRYAVLNREWMFRTYKDIIAEIFTWVDFAEPILCHHNYMAEEEHDGKKLYVTRKGAISAREGEMAIIPGAMGRKSFIVRGLGSAESFTSASHGAGRRMSRSAAKKKFSEADLTRSTDGVLCRKDAGVIDEIAEAYKDVDAVMAYQSDLVEPIHELRSVLCVKG